VPFCNACGAKYEAGIGQCPACAKPLPALPAPREAASLDTLSPPRARRFAAGVIDLLIAYGLVAWIEFLLARRFPVLRGIWFVGTLAILLCPNPYLLLKDAIEGKSIGKLVMGLVVFNEQERRPTGLLDSTIRNWYLIVPLVGPVLVSVVVGVQILTGRRRRIGDAGAHTLVISDLDYQRIR